MIDCFYNRAGEGAKVFRRPKAAMPLQFIAAKVFLRGFVPGRADNDHFVGARQRIPQQSEAGFLVKMLQDVAKENQVIAGQRFH